MTDTKYHIFTLGNGLRCVHHQSSGAVGYSGMIVNAGSRDEGDDSQGLAHFVEHTLFKGTRRRSSWHISNRMECIGGELNAYTSKEETVIYTNSPAGNTARAFELIADLIANSTFPEKELEKERDVVIEEINSYLDSPGESIFDRFEERIYAGNSMAHNILGTPQSVQALTGTDARGFIDTHYTPANMVLYCADSISHAKVEALAGKYFGHLHFETPQSGRKTPAVLSPFNEVIDEDGHQAHTIMGARVCNRHSEDRYALFLLNNHLGGPCMNSILNQELRDRRGLVYTVDSTVALLSDCGLMQIYFGSDARQVERCKKLILRNLEILAERAMKPHSFDRLKRQYTGQLRVGSDQRESMAMSLGKSVLYYGNVHDVEWTSARIADVTAEQMRAMAENVLSSGLSILTLK